MALKDSLKFVTSALKLKYLRWSLKVCYLDIKLATVYKKSCFKLQSLKK
jgi:hypothetical protein